MKQLMNSEVALLNIDDESDERAFSYEMNRKRTRTKLLKGAKRSKHLEVEVKSSCVNLRFNDGSYYEVILPLLKEWHSKVNSLIKINDQDIHIIEIEKGFEKSKKHVDTKLVIVLDEWKKNCPLLKLHLEY